MEQFPEGDPAKWFIPIQGGQTIDLHQGFRKSETYKFSFNLKHEEPINKETKDFMEDFYRKKQTKPAQTRDLSII